MPWPEGWEAARCRNQQPSKQISTSNNCPAVRPGEIVASRILRAHPADTSAYLTDAHKDWIDAGLGTVKEWQRTLGTIPDSCLVGLAKVAREAYEKSIFPANPDNGLKDHFARLEHLNLQSLRNAAKVAPESKVERGQFEVRKVVSTAVTETETVPEFDAIYRPAPGLAPDPGNWSGLSELTRWRVKLVPSKERLLITSINLSPAPNQ